MLDYVIDMLGSNGFRVNKRKCSILCSTVTFLGIELSTFGFNGIPVERRNLLANIRTPRSLAELFCRVCQFSYSSSYIPQYSKLVAPLRKVIKSNVFTWSPVEEKCFRAIKLAIGLNLYNYSIDKNLPLLVMVDSSKVATSYMAFQIKDGDLKIVDMDSRIFSQPEMGSPSVAREAMGVSYGLKKLEVLIRSHDKRTVLFTDC